MLRGDKYRVALVAATVLVLLACLACFAFGIVISSQSSADMEFSVQSSPTFLSYLATTLLGLQLAVAGLGLMGSLKKSYKSLVWFFRLCTLTLIFNLAIFMYILLAGNGVFSENTGFLSEYTEGLATKWTLEQPALWKRYQDESTCCGFNFRSGYESDQNGYEDLPEFDLEDAYSGEKCKGFPLEQLRSLQTQYPVYNETAQEAADNHPIFKDITFFCYFKVVKMMRDFAYYGGVALGVYISFQAVSLFLASMLVFSIKQEDGGLKLENDFVLPDEFPENRGPCCPCFRRKKRNMVGNPVIKYN